MPRFFPGSRWPLAVAAALAATLSAGCMRPLAVQHEYFSPVNGSIAKASVRTRHTLAHHVALQAAERACPPGAVSPAPPAEPGRPTGGPDLGRLAGRDALAGICAGTIAGTRPVSAYGASSNAYRRWVEDRVRPLPAPSETASSAGGS